VNRRMSGGNTKPRPVAGESGGVTAKETFQTLIEISKILNTGMDETTLALCVRLCESGANPDSLAQVVQELLRVKREEMAQ